MGLLEGLALILFGYLLPLYLISALVVFYRKRSSEFKKYKIHSLDYRFKINNLSQKQVYKTVMNWVKEINPTKIETNSLDSIQFLHVNEWILNDMRFRGWQKNIDIQIHPVGDLWEVYISMVPTEDYQISPIGESVLIGWEKMAVQLSEIFDSNNRASSFQDVHDGRYFRMMLDGYKRAYQISAFLLVVFTAMCFYPMCLEPGWIAGTSFGIGIIGFMIDMYKFAEDYGTYCDVKRKIPKYLENK